MKIPEKKKSGGSVPEGWASTHQWISRFLEDKTTPRKIVHWHAWALSHMKQGWSRTEIEDRIRKSWHQHTMSRDMSPLEPELLDVLREVYKLADSGGTPSQCAVVYRSLAKQYPSRDWLSDWADRWEEAGSDWKAVVLP